MRITAVIALFVVGIVIGRQWHRSNPEPATHQRKAAVATYRNPVFNHDFPDPDVVWTGRSYVAAATGDASEHVQSATSGDLIGWKAGPDLLPTLPAWAASGFGKVWGPTIDRVANRWILWFSAATESTGTECIGWASSSSVTGPYVSSSTVPTVCQSQSGGSIDPSVTMNNAGTRYLLWKNDGNCCGDESNLWSQPLARDGVTVVGQPSLLLSYEPGWETGPTAKESTVEGPSVLHLDDHYFLLVSGNGYLTDTYGMGVALCRTLSGPCAAQSADPVLSATSDVAGPGGGSAFFDRYGQPWLAYAAWTPPLVGDVAGAQRSLRIDRITTVGQLLFILGPTVDRQPGPKA